MTKEELVEFLIKNFRKGDRVDLSNLDFSEYKMSVDICCMKVNGNLFQSCQEVNKNLYQHLQNVGGDLLQSYSSVSGNLHQGQATVHGKIYKAKDIKVKNRRKKL